MTYESLLKLLHKRAEYYGSWYRFAESLQISPQYLHDCKEGRRMPGKKLLDAMGLESVTEYRKVRPAASPDSTQVIDSKDEVKHV